MTNAQLASLYERYSWLVQRRCARLLGSTSEAEDVLHEVFLRAHKSDGPHVEGSSLVWLYRIASHCCIDRIRARVRSDKHLRLASAQSPVHDVDADHRALVGMVLRQVPWQTCEIGLLHFVDGLTQEEIAQQCGYSRRTIGKRLHQFEAEFADRWRQAGGQS